MFDNVMLVQQIEEKTGLKLELPDSKADELCADGVNCPPIKKNKKRLFLFDMVDQDDGEVLVTLVFPKKWLGKIGLGGSGGFVAIIYALIHSGLLG